MKTTLREVEYKDSDGIVRSWLLVKYQAINKVCEGISLSDNAGRSELVYDYQCPGSDLFFNDKKFETMSASGYFTGMPGRYQGEGGVILTEKAVNEIMLDMMQMDEAKAKLVELGYKLFTDFHLIRSKFDDNTFSADSVLRWLYGLYLIPEKEIGNIQPGTLLVSSDNAKELLYDGEMDLQLKDGFSIFGIRPMPKYVDSKLLIDSK